jgi:hypothetical protein
MGEDVTSMRALGRLRPCLSLTSERTEKEPRITTDQESRPLRICAEKLEGRSSFIQPMHPSIDSNPTTLRSGMQENRATNA